MSVQRWSRRIFSDSNSGSYASPDDSSLGRAAGTSFTNEANFDTNMVITLAALLCALICALGLNSILRCALRCSTRFGSGESDSRISSAWLKKSAMRRIPLAVYKTLELNITATECLICLGEFVDGEKVRVLPRCNHGFHVKCIDTWLAVHSSCPTCRGSLVECSSAGPCSSAEQHVQLQVNAAAHVAG